MINVKLDYGKKGLGILLKDADVYSPREVNEIINPDCYIREKILNPDYGKGLDLIVQGKKTVAIAHTDITRATPNHIIVPILIDSLLKAGIEKENIVLVNMTGSHRPQTEEELKVMLTEDVVRNIRCVQHNSFDYDTMTFAGELDGYPLFINKDFLAADVKIITGFIEPHFFAGFSGGPKAILPGISDIKSIMRNHNAVRIASNNATWGITQGNPVWENLRDGARIVNPDFLLNVTLNTEGKITGVFTGEWEKAHRKGYEFLIEHAMIPIKKKYDIVITTNSGYPLDMNLYQCVKGISTAAEIVKDGGTIIIAGECSEGIPKGSNYHKVLMSESSPEKIFNKIVNSDKVIPEQWQVQIQARIQKKVKVYIYSEILTEEEIHEAKLLPCNDIPRLVKSLGGEIAVIPHGPMTLFSR